MIQFPLRIALSAMVAISTTWLLTVCVLATRFNIPSGDGILYSLPLAVARHPFDFGIPFLDGFEGYGSFWGHQWPGTMWLRGLIFSALPYSRTADVAVLSAFQLLAAATAGWLVWKATDKIWPSAAAFVMMLSDRLLLLACAGNRFEAIPVAVVLLLFANSTGAINPRKAGWHWLTCVLAFACPTLHPYALAMGGLILGYDCISARLRNDPSRRQCDLRLASFFCGCLALAAWFAFQPEAMRQFTANITLQKSFSRNWNSVIDGLSNYRISGGLVLWGAGLLASCALVTGVVRSSLGWRFLAPSLFLVVAAIHTVTRCENFTYLAFGTPFAVMMVCVAVAKPAGESASILRWLAVASLATIIAIHAIILPYRIRQFWQAGRPNIDASLTAILNETPRDATVYLPYMFWPAAARDKTHHIHWSTLPIASLRATRERYEKTAYATAKPGDRLIIDCGAASLPDRFGVHPTFPQLPPDPVRWNLIANHKLLFAGSIPWGFDLAVYEFRPQENPPR